MQRTFQKKIESFECAVCGVLVQGDGYTNHCPQCLWSRHCDINPGDRAETCQGLMEPVAYGLKHGEKTLVHRCQKCGVERQNRLDPNDNLKRLYQLPMLPPGKIP